MGGFIMEYELKIKTGDQYLAGTDSNIFVILEGEYGESEERRLNGYISGNAFERNCTDSATIDFGADVGRVFRIKLRSDMMYAGAGWLLAYIEIKRKDTSNSLSNTVSRFNINQWIEDKKTHTFTVAYSEWAKNIAAYETTVLEYKKYPFTVPANGEYMYNQTEKITTGFTYSSTVTKKSTQEYNEKLGGKADYSSKKEGADKLTNAKNYSGYLEFAFKQGFESSEINQIVQTENKEIQKTVQSKVTNPTAKEKKYEAVFSLVKVDAVTSTGSIVAMFSANAGIEFSGFREV